MLMAPMKDLIATFPLGFVATVTSDGAPIGRRSLAIWQNA